MAGAEWGREHEARKEMGNQILSSLVGHYKGWLLPSETEDLQRVLN